MTNDYYNAAELSESTTPLGLCYLMVDLEVLGIELLAAEEVLGCGHQGLLAHRLRRAGLSNQKVEEFSTWRRRVSELVDSKAGDEDHLTKIAAAEKAGLTLLAEIIERLSTHNQQINSSNAQIEALAA
jgi:hypothetical protein